jgi:hypothetical protein
VVRGGCLLASGYDEAIGQIVAAASAGRTFTRAPTTEEGTRSSLQIELHQRQPNIAWRAALVIATTAGCFNRRSAEMA